MNMFAIKRINIHKISYQHYAKKTWFNFYFYVIIFADKLFWSNVWLEKIMIQKI